MTAMADSDDWSMAEVVRALKRIETKLDDAPERYVTRTEWLERNNVVNGGMGELRDALKSSRATTLSVVSMLIAGGSVVLGVVLR